MTRTILLTFYLLFAGIAHSEECSHLWTAELNVGPYVQKGLSGDTNAGYALLAFRPETNLKLVLQGRYPQARFFSFETYSSKLMIRNDALLDLNIIPMQGYTSPFSAGHYLENQYFEIQLSKYKALSVPGINTLELAPNFFAQVLLMRIFDPTGSISGFDIPKIYAVDEKTGVARNCPLAVQVPFHLDFPQIIGQLAPRTPILKFNRSGNVSGGNTAIPGYIYALTQMNFDDIALVRFKHTPARYSSFCIQNFLKNETLSCLPDRLTTTDSNNFNFIAISENFELLKTAQQSGWNTLSFQRGPNQAVIGLVYRNLLPQIQEVYEGPYAPQGVICNGVDFLAGNCHLY